MQTIPIMIIDDEEVDRYLLNRQLEETGLLLKVYEAHNATAGLDFFQKHNSQHLEEPELYPPVIVFLDINMPGLNGFEFLAEFEKLRAQIDLSASVVMMFSSSERPEDQEKALSFSFVKDYLVKGKFDSETLKKKITGIVA